MLHFPFLFDVTSWGDWQDAAEDHGWSILAIVAILLVARFLSHRLVGRVLEAALRSASLAGRDDPVALKGRADTLRSTVDWAVTLFLFFLGITLVLDEVGVSVTALIAGVGLAGIAIGLGAQALVKDVINGLFILVEDQYRVGDVVRVAGTSGLVVEITPRRTVLRDLDGYLHSIPNGEIGVATNMTRDFSRINLDVTVAYEEDIARVIPVVNEVCSALQAERPADFVTTPTVLRVDSLGADGIDLKVLGDVQPGKQWELMGELRRRLKTRFDEMHVEIPYHREVQVPWDLLVANRASAPAAPTSGDQRP